MGAHDGRDAREMGEKTMLLMRRADRRKENLKKDRKKGGSLQRWKKNLGNNGGWQRAG